MSLSHDILRAEIMRELIVQHVVGDALRAAIAIVEHSYGHGCDAACFAEHEDLAALLGWDKTQCSRALRELRAREIIEVYPYAGAWWFEPRPCGRWLPPPEKIRKTLISADRVQTQRAAWNATRDAIRDPRQREFGFKPGEIRDPRAAAIGAESRKVGGARVDGPSTGRCRTASDPPRVDGPSTGPDPATDAGASARACDHDYEETPSLTDHDHERWVAEEAGGGSLEWNDLHQEILEFVERVCDPAPLRRKHRLDWEARIRAKPSLVREVCAEVGRMKVEGKLRRADNPGCALNRIYLDWSGEKKMIYAKKTTH